MKIGCHISVSKGFLKAAESASNLGANTFQIFTKNPRSFKSKIINMEDASKGKEYCTENKISVVCHTPYITNLSTPKPDLQEATILSIVEDLKITEAYGSFGAVVHCGKHVGEGVEYGIDRMVETLNHILARYNGPAKILLENTAGQGTELGLDPKTLVEIRNMTKFPERIGFCFDTCHAFSAGQWNDETFSEFINTAEKAGYLDLIEVIHFNDSKVPYSSKKDRHEKIGSGEIGAIALQKILNYNKFADIPFILETPVEKEIDYKDEIILVQKLLNK